MQNRSLSMLSFAFVITTGCAPEEVVVSTDTLRGTLRSEPITPAELAAGAGHRGNDGVAPEDGIDGDPLSVLARERELEASEGALSRSGLGAAVQAITACTQTTGYESGSPRSICVATVDGKMVEVNTANAFLAMRAAAARDGVSIYIVSGFRTMEHQRYLYNLYLSGQGNLAAPPGYSNHQNGLALDLNTADAGVYRWLANNASRYHFRRTVPSEDWHWEHDGTRAASSDPNASGERCWSASYNRWMEGGTCLQSRLDDKWYQSHTELRRTHGEMKLDVGAPARSREFL